MQGGRWKGRGTGLSTSSFQHWHQDAAPDINDTAEPGDWFGYALAVGDFDGNGHFDLAVGLPGQAVGGDAQAGAVHVLYGQPAGVHWQGDQVWHQDIGSVQSISEVGDQFGKALAAGDFDRDGYDDLAVGVPLEDWDLLNSGIVQILYGSPTGLSDIANQLYRQGFGGLPEAEQAGDQFGESLAVGDFDHDGYADLAIGVPHEDFESPARSDVGVVHVLYGQPGGLTTIGNTLLHQDRPGILDDAEEFDYFGQALTTGDLNGDDYDDLAVGVPGEDVAGEAGAGAVHILEGRSGGLTVTGNRLLGAAGLVPQSGARLGNALASGDFDGDGYADLAVGIPWFDYTLLSRENCGAVEVRYGSNDGPSDTRYGYWLQGSLFGLTEQLEAGDFFGWSLAAGDFNGDGFADLAIGAPDEDIVYGGDPRIEAGYVHALYGTSSGLSTSNDQGWHQDGMNVMDAPGDYERFGYALAAYPGTYHRIYLPMVARNF